jgi:hypothetical protein
MELNYRFVINNYWLRMINSTASLCLLMTKYIFHIVFIAVIYLPNKVFAECEELGYGAKFKPNIISIIRNDNFSRKKVIAYDVAVLKLVDGMEFSSMNLIKGCLDDSNEFALIQMNTYEESGKILSDVTVRPEEPNEWYIKVYYSPPRKVGIVVDDGPAMESWEELKHNKVKNLRSLRSLGRAENARPF